MIKTIKDLSIYDLKKIASMNSSQEVELVELKTTLLRIDIIAKAHTEEIVFLADKPKYKKISLVVDSIKFILIANN